MKKTELQKAYEDWVDQAPTPIYNTIPEKDGLCCGHSHFFYNGRSMANPKPDDQVCSREYTWRKYVRLRDGNKTWPFETCENGFLIIEDPANSSAGGRMWVALSWAEVLKVISDIFKETANERRV